MTLQELKDIIKRENLFGELLSVFDTRIFPYIDELRRPNDIVLKIDNNNMYHLAIHDERGFKIKEKNNLSEHEACEIVLRLLREYTREFSYNNEEDKKKESKIM